MKPIRGLEKATPGLDDFVSRFPGERNWKAFTDHEGSKAHKELDRQVEHFRPKSDRKGAANHTTACDNLMAACCGGSRGDVWGPQKPGEEPRDPVRYRDPTRKNLSCGQAKGDRELKVDPRALPASASIMRVATLDGRMEPDETGCAAVGVDREAVSKAIDILGLNCERLRVARADRLENLAGAYNGMDVEVLIAVAQRDLLPDASGRLLRFFTTTRTFFGGAAELVLAEQSAAG